MIVYTDGSYKKKNNKIYCGYGIYFPNGEIKNKSKKFELEPITNNRAELYAILHTLKLCFNYNKINKISILTIYSDSEYSVKTINIWYNNWLKNGKDYKNEDIINEIMNYINNKCNFEIKIMHINSHTKINDIHHKNNEMADLLAKNGSLK